MPVPANVRPQILPMQNCQNQYQAQVQANCDEMELIHVSFASPLCICVHMVFCMRKLQINGFLE